MLPEKLEQLQSGDQSFWFRLMVTTDSTEVTGIAIAKCPLYTHKTPTKLPLYNPSGLEDTTKMTAHSRQ
jgi:hypothetical protein